MNEVSGMLSLRHRAAVVTGASEGIGFAVADCLSAAGAAVVLLARDRERLDQAVVALRRRGRCVTALAGDVADASVRGQAIATCVEEFGSVDVLVNNAGTQGPIGPMVDTSGIEFQRVLEINLVSPLMMVREAYTSWMAQHGGSIVNITSLAGIRPQANYGAYGGAKAALEHQTRVLAKELAPRVRVNSVAPGLVMTRLSLAGTSDSFRHKAAGRTPMRRLGDPEDVAKAVLFLSSEASSWITGIVVPVDGGALVS